MEAALPADEWRVEVELDDPEHGYSFSERLRARDLDDQARERLGDRVVVTRDGSQVFLYAGSEPYAREAERVAGELIEQDQLTAEVEVTRWHPVEHAWRSAEEPLPASERERAAEYERRLAAERREAAEEGEYDWEVRLELRDREDAAALAERLADEGQPVLRRWRYLWIGALTEERAEELADRMRAEAPAGTRVAIEANLERPTYPPLVFLESLGGPP